MTAAEPGAVLAAGASWVGGPDSYSATPLSPAAQYRRRHGDHLADKDGERAEEQLRAELASSRESAEMLGLVSARSVSEVLAAAVDGQRRQDLADERLLQRQAAWEGRPDQDAQYRERRRRALRESAAAREADEVESASRGELRRLAGQVAAISVRVARGGH